MSVNSDRTRTAPSKVSSETEPSARAVEPWFLVLLSSLLPLVGALFAPPGWRTPLHVIGGALCGWGLILLVRHELADRRTSHVTDG